MKYYDIQLLLSIVVECSNDVLRLPALLLMAAFDLLSSAPSDILGLVRESS
jgi:hypothetical protein